ncbi:MAG: hypothetical protein AXW12_00475 [Thalassospira sp. Nap_22]|nr:MAG: hypothetical protein AXW12_00475 [Thalassospira sp. Nap_22]
MSETICKLYLELSHVVPAGTKTAKEVEVERHIKIALMHMDSASPQLRNGPMYQASDHLRKAIGLKPVGIGGKFSEGIDNV